MNQAHYEQVVQHPYRLMIFDSMDGRWSGLWDSSPRNFVAVPESAFLLYLYKYSNNLLPPAINDLYVYNNDVHKYSTRQNICFVFIGVAIMSMQKALETQFFVYGMLYSPKLM